MSGRLYNPGEVDPYDMMDQESVFNRTVRAQVQQVKNEDGYLVVALSGLSASSKHVTVNPLWASFPRNGGAAWGRFMPQESDILKISFDRDNTPHVVGYDVLANSSKVGDGRSGWPDLNKLYQEAQSNPSKRIGPDKIPIARFSQFTPLKPGEYDFMSSGGAYIKGTSAGKLYMAGGAVSISLIRSQLLMSCVSQLLVHKADDCQLRFGQVRRKSLDEGDKKISTDTNGSLKEFYVRLQTTLGGGAATDLARMQLGNVIMDSGVGSEQLDGADLRSLLRTYNNGVVAFEHMVDVNGNSQINGTGTNFKINYDTGSLELKFGSSATIKSPAINLQGLDEDAQHPLILSNTYKSAETEVIMNLANHINFLHTTVNAIITALQAGGTASTPPIVGAIAMGKIFNAAAAVLSPLMSSYSSSPVAAVTSANKFNNSYDSYLSKIVKTA